MFKPKRVAARLVAVLGGAGLAFGLCVPGAKAIGPLPPPFSNSNYNNRYVCNETAGTAGASNTFTAEIELFSNGSGTFTSGTMAAPISADGGAFTAGAPPSGSAGNFCEFDLNIAGSSYAVAADGIGIEVLSWSAAAGNNPLCTTPYSLTTFTQSDAFVLRLNGIKPNGAVVRTEVTSNNLLGQGDPGTGHCLK